ncbi:MAG: hypothetical protein QG616_2282 [Pseudomonadota bacterium]|nr:hypothetical protein [Pseudomonadota bacterium]MDQ5902928.1 hypothetical protein [Pseudomonadota bacterium]MDQ5914375.1 hypothetical protein [Pseudomonadota bacterium]MDQ5942774.1 hypothetical protein [Pseudomonadota bacterium]MDQ5946428.1 hypothetical protein [Pseudomonadota bacterium]
MQSHEQFVSLFLRRENVAISALFDPVGVTTALVGDDGQTASHGLDDYPAGCLMKLWRCPVIKNIKCAKEFLRALLVDFKQFNARLVLKAGCKTGAAHDPSAYSMPAEHPVQRWIFGVMFVHDVS